MSWALDHAVYLRRLEVAALRRKDWDELVRVRRLADAARLGLDSVDSNNYSAWASEGPVPVVDVTGRHRKAEP